MPEELKRQEEETSVKNIETSEEPMQIQIIMESIN